MAGRIRSTKNSSDIIGTRTRDIPACSAVPQPTSPPRTPKSCVDCVLNVMVHAQKSDFVFRRNELVHLNRHGRQFSRLLAAELCASAVVMRDTPSSEVVKSTGYPLLSPFSPSILLPCVTVCHHVSTGLYVQ